MDGPNVAWYIAIAAVLFGIGALGVLIRRNTLVVLLSLELMLNAGNLALIALSRHWHNGAGQIFALAAMAGPAPAGCGGRRLAASPHRRKPSAPRDPLFPARGWPRARRAAPAPPLAPP